MLRLPLDELNFSPDPGTPKDVCTPESPCDIGEGPCTGKDTCQNGLRCGTENCALFAGNNNNENCCYDPYRPGKIYSFPRLSFFLQAGEGDQFVFDLNTVLGKQMAKTLDWLDESDEETTVTCCTREGPKTKTCGGESGQSCQNVCGKGDSFHLFSPFHSLSPFQ